MENEIKGYVLKDEKYRKAALTLFTDSDYLKSGKGWITKYSNTARTFRDLGLFELWFEPVYEEIEFKVGDICVNLDDSHNYFDGEIGELEYFQYGYFTFKGKPQGEGYRKPIEYLRHATTEEIEKYKSLKLPKINGYDGIYSEILKRIQYGCAEILPEWFHQSENRGIKSITLSSGVVINEEQVNQIRKFLNRRQK